MKEFACANIGNQCAWKHSAQTEELLTDVVAVHLRDVHGVKELTADLVGRIKNTFSNPDPIRERAVYEPMLKEFMCRDLGTDCTWHYIAQTEDLLADGVAVHAREVHGIKEFTPELATRVKLLAHEWMG